MDDKDQQCWHVSGYENGKLVAYTRLVPPGISYPEPSIGRVITTPTMRGSGIGRILMQYSIEKIFSIFGKQCIKIGAQLYLKKFYESLGFSVSGPVYLEDGIDHVEMRFPILEN
jgi:ElaA protein